MAERNNRKSFDKWDEIDDLAADLLYRKGGFRGGIRDYFMGQEDKEGSRDCFKEMHRQ